LKIPKAIKVALFSIVSVLVVLGFVALAYVNTSIKPHDIEEYSKNKIQELIPDSLVSMGSVAFSLKTSLLLTVEDFRISRSLNKNQLELFSTSQLRIKVPLTSLLFGGGNIDIGMVKPNILIGANSWRIKSSHLSNGEMKKAKIVIPSFVANSTFDVRANNLRVHYGTIKENQKSYNIDKFILKNFGLTTNAAFELRSRVNLLPFEKKVSFLMTNIGSFSISKYLKTGIFTVSSSYKIQDLSINKEQSLSRVIHGGITAKLGHEGKIVGEVTSLAERSRLSGFYSWTNKKVAFTGLKGELLFSDFISILPSGSSFDYSLASLKLEGVVEIDNQEYRPSLNYNLSSLQQVIADKVVTHNLSGQFNNSKITLAYKTLGLGGSFSGDFSTNYSLMSTDPIEKRFKDYEGKLYVDGVSLNRNTYKALLSLFDNFRDRKKRPVQMPVGKLVIDVKNSKLKAPLIDFSGVIESQANKLLFKNFNLTSAGGEAQFSSSLTFYNNKTYEVFNLKLKDFELRTLFSFFPQSRPHVFGKANGAFTFEKKEKDSYELKMNVTSGGIVNLNVEDEILNVKELFDNIPSVSSEIGVGHPVIENNFSKLKISALMKNDLLKISNLSLISESGKLALNGSGGLSNSRGSKLNLFLKDEFGFSRRWKKLTGKSSLPLECSLTSSGVSVNELFTVEKLASLIIKKSGLKRAKALLKEEKKVLRNKFGSKKMKKILKGVYK
jgi:hypothetical protein